MELRPKQRIPESQKNREWRRQNLQYIRDLRMQTFMSTEDYKLLQLCAGEAKYTDYSYVTNPFNLKDSRYHRWPAKLRNFDFISPIFRRLIAEFTERQAEPIVYTRNSNFDSEVAAYEKELINQSLQQRFINKLIESGLFQPGQVDAEGQEVEPPMSPEVIKQQSSSLKDLITIEGQHVVNYIRDHQKLDEVYRKAWADFIQLNRCFTYKTVLRDHVKVENISPMSVEYYGNRNIKVLEDAEYIRARYLLTYTEVLEIFQDIFEEEEYKKEYGDIADQLEQRIQRHSSSGGTLPFSKIYFNNRGNFYDNDDISANEEIEVQHVCWTGFRMVKQVWDAETGQILDLSEDYQGDDIINITWYPVEYDGYIIDDKYFIGGYPLPIQRVDPDNPFSTKKEYNGKIFLQGEVKQVRLAEILAKYQEAYNIVKFKIQNIINKNKDKILVLPLGLLHSGTRDTENNAVADLDDDLSGLEQRPENDPEDGDSPIAKALYYMDATQTLMIDETSEHAALALQGIKSIDLSLGNYLSYLIEYANVIRTEAEELVGYNRYRTSRTTPSDAVTNVQQGIYAGSQIVEPYFTEFESFLATEYQGIIDLSQHAFRVGKKAAYVRSNTDVAIMEITEGFPRAVYGVFVRASSKTKRVREELKARANELLQNGMAGAPSIIAKIISGDFNYAEIIQELENKERELLEQQQAQQEADRQNALAIEQMRAEEAQKDRDLKKYAIDMGIYEAMLRSISTGMGFAANGGNEEGFAKLESQANKVLIEAQKLQVKQSEIAAKERMNRENNDTKRYVADKTLAVAKENKP